MSPGRIRGAVSIAIAVVGGLAIAVAAVVVLAMGLGGGKSGTVAGLITAQYQQCGQEGETLAGYLTTGNPTSYDPNWGDYRQYVLTLSGPGQALYVRQEADSVIEQCDTAQTVARGRA